MQNLQDVQRAAEALRLAIQAALPASALPVGARPLGAADLPEAGAPLGIVLGTGLSGLVDKLRDVVSVPYADVPGFPLSGVEGHAGCFVWGRFPGACGDDDAQGRYVLVQQGRCHLYEGRSPAQVCMIVGEHNRDNDIDVNATKEKKLTNLRASGKDENVTLTPVKKMTLEHALHFVREDELVEVTPLSIRLRKNELSAMLGDTLPKDCEGKVLEGAAGLFAEAGGTLVATSEAGAKPGDHCPLRNEWLALGQGECTSGLESVDGVLYAVGCARSRGYREYKRDGRYANDVLCVMRLPI